MLCRRRETKNDPTRSQLPFIKYSKRIHRTLQVILSIVQKSKRFVWIPSKRLGVGRGLALPPNL